MNKQVVLLILALGMSAPLIANQCCVTCEKGVCDSCECKTTAKTFFTARPQFQGVMPERQTFMRDRMWADEDGHHGVASITLYGGKSTNCGRYAGYFGPSCGNTWHVTNDVQAASDIQASYFNIFTKSSHFESEISFAPQQTVFGIGLHYKQSLARDCDEKGCFIEISMPIEHVTNTMGFTENVINNGGGALSADMPANMAQAFKQPAFHYGRIYASDGSACNNGCAGCSLDKWGVADIDVRLGWECVKQDTVTLDSFVGILIPTGNKPRAVNLFEPIVGDNRHFGLSFGSYTGIEIWENCEKDRRVWLSANFYAAYLCKNTQTRLIDVYDKPWSHYMYVYDSMLSASQAATAYANGDDSAQYLNTPGVNIFAQNLCVRPGFQLSCNTALVYTACNFDAEIGCNFFAREAECIKLACCWKEGPAFKSPAVVATTGYTDSVETIGNFYGYKNITPVNNYIAPDVVTGNYQSNIIKESDLNLNSAAHPAVITYNIYGALGYRWDECNHPRFVGLGGSWEFAPDNTGLDRWLIWAKAGLSF